MQANTDPVYLESQGLSATFPQRFMAKVEITETHWLWRGATKVERKMYRYGRISKGKAITGMGHDILAHRASWILFRGPIPDGKMVLHVCPEGSFSMCVNPNHLQLGDQFDNMRQMTAEGKNHFSHVKYPRPGELSPSAKLTWAQVREIRRLRAEEHLSGIAIAARFATSRRNVGLIIAHKHWIEPVSG